MRPVHQVHALGRRKTGKIHSETKTTTELLQHDDAYKRLLFNVS